MTDFVLVLNSGSSSVKFAVINVQTTEQVLHGIAECLGALNAQISWQHSGLPHSTAQSPANQKHTHALAENSYHLAAIQALVEIINQHQLTSAINVIGHRVVHGGEKFFNSVVITDEVEAEIKANNKLAPLHNPANLLGIQATKKLFPHLKQVAVFDTAFHQTLAKKAFLYAIPYSLYQLEGIRKYGFHGTSHRYVAEQASQLLDKKFSESHLITAHLGNGCSICAIKNGESVDTSMGFTPLGGICMGTRSGDVDPGLLNFLVNELAYSMEQVDQVLNKQSGLLGISQLSNDCRELQEAAQAGNKQAELALDVFSYQIAKTIAAYTVPLGKLDAIVFTGGIGENSAYVRAKVVSLLTIFGLVLSEQENMNKRFGEQGCITSNDGIKALVIPTNEELVIALDAIALLQDTSNEKEIC
ncbi:acetate kinase [Thalassotalea agariperforans]